MDVLPQQAPCWPGADGDGVGLVPILSLPRMCSRCNTPIPIVIIPAGINRCRRMKLPHLLAVSLSLAIAVAPTGLSLVHPCIYSVYLCIYKFFTQGLILRLTPRLSYF